MSVAALCVDVWHDRNASKQHCSVSSSSLSPPIHSTATTSTAATTNTSSTHDSSHGTPSDAAHARLLSVEPAPTSITSASLKEGTRPSGQRIEGQTRGDDDDDNNNDATMSEWSSQAPSSSKRPASAGTPFSHVPPSSWTSSSVSSRDEQRYGRKPILRPLTAHLDGAEAQRSTFRSPPSVAPHAAAAAAHQHPRSPPLLIASGLASESSPSGSGHEVTATSTRPRRISDVTWAHTLERTRLPHSRPPRSSGAAAAAAERSGAAASLSNALTPPMPASASAAASHNAAKFQHPSQLSKVALGMLPAPSPSLVWARSQRDILARANVPPLGGGRHVVSVRDTGSDGDEEEVDMLQDDEEAPLTYTVSPTRRRRSSAFRPHSSSSTSSARPSTAGDRWHASRPTTGSTSASGATVMTTGNGGDAQTATRNDDGDRGGNNERGSGSSDNRRRGAPDDNSGGEGSGKDGRGAGSGSGAGGGSGGGGEAQEAAARKQNSACDACRNRKVRCHRTPGQDKCNHCKAKGIECTTFYVQLATSAVKRPTKRARADTGHSIAGSSAGGHVATAMGGSSGAVEGPDAATTAMLDEIPTVVRYLLLRESEYANVVHGLSYAEHRRIAPTTAAEARLINSTARQEFVSSLLQTYFSTVHIRYPVLDPQEFLQRFHGSSQDFGGPPSDTMTAVLLAWGAKFSTHPIIMADRRETAKEELTQAQRIKRSIVNPLANLADGALKSTGGGERMSSSGSGGSDAVPYDGNRVMGRSRIAEDLIIKAQEVLDRNKAHRIASLENAKAAIIIQALFWQQASDTDDDDGVASSHVPAQLRPRKRRGVYICNGIWINCAIAHMYEMRVHLDETVQKIASEVQRGQVAMTWYLALMFDAHMSAFYRRKPLIAKDDYSTMPPEMPSSGPQAGPSPVASSEGYRIWLASAMEQCEMMRAVYFTLWTPRAYESGVSARKLEKLIGLAYRWRSNHLHLVGAPHPNWPSNWQFSDAITACASDINYHVIWLLMWQAVEESGIAELKATTVQQYNLVGTLHGTSDAGAAPASKAEMELDQSKVSGMRNAIYDEALKAALRCADLSKMLCDSNYLQNEAGIMKFALCEAGYLLTRFRRQEVYMIIDGLRQYGQAFEECYEQADELERLAAEYDQQVAVPAGLPMIEHAASGYAASSAAPPLPSTSAPSSMEHVLPPFTHIVDHGRDYSHNYPGMHTFATQIMHQHNLQNPSSSSSRYRSMQQAPPATYHSQPRQPSQQPQQAHSPYGAAAPLHSSSGGGGGGGGYGSATPYEYHGAGGSSGNNTNNSSNKSTHFF